MAFPLLIHNALQFLASRDEAADVAGASVRAGETITLAPGESIWTHPQTSYQPLPPGGIPAAESVVGPGVFQPVRNGFYLRRDADGTIAWLAVNTGDRTMSALNAPGAATASRIRTHANRGKVRRLVGSRARLAAVGLLGVDRIHTLRAGMVGLPPAADRVRAMVATGISFPFARMRPS